MKTYSFYDPASGTFSGATFAGAERLLERNTPVGMVAIEGRFDHMSQRVENGQVVDYQPPRPDEEHEWGLDERGRRRWVKTADVLARERKQIAARQAIAEIEAKQVRSLVELRLDSEAADKDGKPIIDLLREREAEIAEHRKDLAEPVGAVLVDP